MMLHYRKYWSGLLLAVFFIFSPQLRAGEQQGTSIPDVRILIDVSGSMKKNDPNNLRVPSLELFTRLLPLGVTAGIWFFAEDAWVQIPPSTVTKQWKAKALQIANKTHYRGQFTDIETALSNACSNGTSGNSENRHVILLTDGVVDVSKNASESAASRQRILSESISHCQRMGASIHTISLSNNADAALMKNLSMATGGWSETIESASGLQKVFVELFDQSVSPDKLPIDKDGVLIDPLAKEFSLVVFSDGMSPDVSLVSPSGEAYQHDTLDPSIDWYRGAGVELITVTDPGDGRWRIVGTRNPDNQLMVISDLKLRVEGMPSYLVEGESLSFSAYLTNKDQTITSARFHKIIKVTVGQLDTSNQQLVQSPLAIEEPNSGTYQKMIKGLKAGIYEMTVLADGLTFQRQKTMRLEVIDLPVVQKLIEYDERSGMLTVSLRSTKKIVNTQTLIIKSTLSINDEEGRAVSFVYQPERDLWLFSKEMAYGFERALLTTLVIGGTGEQKFELVLKPLQVDSGSRPSDVEEPEPDEVELSIDESEMEDELEMDDEALDEESEEMSEDESADDTDDDGSWVMMVMIIVGINVIVGLLGYIGFRFWKKRELQKQQKILAEME